MNLQHRRPVPGRKVRAGVELSNDSVRVVELSGGYATSPSSIAEIPLPPGAVCDGEITDREAAAAAIRAGWAEHGLRARSVIVGLGVQSTAERIVELPPLSKRDLRSALEFELADLLPFPVEESIVHPIELSRVTDGSDREVVRHLCIAAHRPPVVDLVQTMNDAGLRVLALDLLGLAGLRTVRCANPAPGTGAVVTIGHGTLSVVVHRDGRPQFVRGIVVSNETTGVSGDLARELSMIDSLRGGEQPSHVGSQTRDQLTEAVLATLAYHESLDPDVAVERVEILGRADRAPQIARDLASATDYPVSLLSLDDEPRFDPVDADGSPATGASTADGHDGDYGVALGLGIASRNDAAGTAWPQLSPGNVEHVGRRRVRVGAASAVAGLAVVACGIVFTADPAPAVAEAAAVRQQASQVDRELTELGGAVEDASDTVKLERLVSQARRSAIPWVELSNSLRQSAPKDSVVQAIDGTSASAGDPATVTLTIETTDSADIERWLSLLAGVDQLKEPWLLESADSGNGSTVFTVRAQVAAGDADSAGASQATDTNGGQ